MPESEQEVKNGAKTKSSKSLPERAREVEEQWRAEIGLSKGLHRRGNAMGGKVGGEPNVPRNRRPLFDIDVIAKSSLESSARHPRCGALILLVW